MQFWFLAIFSHLWILRLHRDAPTLYPTALVTCEGDVIMDTPDQAQIMRGYFINLTWWINQLVPILFLFCACAFNCSAWADDWLLHLRSVGLSDFIVLFVLLCIRCVLVTDGLLIGCSLLIRLCIYWFVSVCLWVLDWLMIRCLMCLCLLICVTVVWLCWVVSVDLFAL